MTTIIAQTIAADLVGGVTVILWVICGLFMAVVWILFPFIVCARLDRIINLLSTPQAKGTKEQMTRWEIIADNLSKAGWNCGCVSALDREGRTIFVADAHRGDGKRFVVRADEKLTAFLELEAAIKRRFG